MRQYLEACQRIWEAYQLYAYHSFVLRSGHWLIGAAKPPLDWVDETNVVSQTFYERAESDLEHQAKVAWLCSVFASNFPNYFNKVALSYRDWWLAMVVGDVHDTGEIVDIPDDGNAQHDTKNYDEYLIMKGFLEAYNDKDARDLLALFASFQDKNSHMGRALYTLDKLEAVLMLLYLEKFDHRGYITNKPCPTEQDDYTVELIGTDCATDCWAAHMLACIKNFPAEILGPVLTLLEVATKDVRGEEFPWLMKVFAEDEFSF